jgi:hypothetical protein
LEYYITSDQSFQASFSDLRIAISGANGSVVHYPRFPPVKPTGRTGEKRAPDAPLFHSVPCIASLLRDARRTAAQTGRFAVVASHPEPYARAEAGPPDGTRIEINYAVEKRDLIQGHHLSDVNFHRHVRLFPCVIYEELERLTSVLSL